MDNTEKKEIEPRTKTGGWPETKGIDEDENEEDRDAPTEKNDNDK